MLTGLDCVQFQEQTKELTRANASIAAGATALAIEQAITANLRSAIAQQEQDASMRAAAIQGLLEAEQAKAIDCLGREAEVDQVLVCLLNLCALRLRAHTYHGW